MKRLFAVAIICFCLLRPALVLAETPPLTLQQADIARSGSADFPVLSLSEAEKKAIIFANQGRYSKAAGLLPSPEMAKPYFDVLLIWLAASRPASDVSYEQIESLYGIQPKWPASYNVAIGVERRITSGKTRLSPAELVRKFEDRKIYLPDMARLYAEALARTDQNAKRSAFLNSYWGETLLSPDEQSDFLRRYDDSLSDAGHQKRLQTLLAPEARQYTNARTLAAEMGDFWLTYVESRIALQNPDSDANPNMWISRLEKQAPHMTKDPYFIRDRFYWHKEQDKDVNNLRALEILQGQPDHPTFLPNERHWWRQQRIIVNRFIAAGQYENAYRLAALNAFEDNEAASDLHFAAGWLALNKLNDPEKARPHFRAMTEIVSTANSMSRAAYWLGLSYQKAGNSKDARYWFDRGARFPFNFYGQLAAEQGGRCVVDDKDKIVSGPIDRSHPFLYAYSYLIQADLKQEAYAFMNFLIRQGYDSQSYDWLARFALYLNEPFHSMLIAKHGYNTHYYLLTDMAFPVLAGPQDGDKINVLSHAIIRQESGFKPDAISRAGALGLMQMMPFVAKKEAQSLGLSYSQSRVLSDPAYNIRLGRHHLERLLKENEGQHIMRVLAGYNAGMGRVREWTGIYGDPGKDGVDPIDWMESIPFPETRDYVRKVLENIVVYSKVLKSDGSATQMTSFCIGQGTKP